jgi:hypothetical protein
LAAALQQGLSEVVGYAEGRNVLIEISLGGKSLRLAADLVRRQVAVIVAGGGNVSPLSRKREQEAKVELVAPQRADEIPRHLGVELYRQRLRCGEHDIWYWPVLAPCGLI